MPKIIKLDPHVADLIAAGEVVERPASVVKELMENSIDAGANMITVEISAGGMTYIRITDNGCGISPEDAKTAFLRHATSKLSDASGLESIGTLGFRGEALAAISAVSRIEMTTSQPGSSEGVRLSLNAGEIIDFSPTGAPEGTTIIVRDLFFNTPARLKFMKTDRAESSAVSATVLRCALAHPEVSVKYIRDGKVEYHTPGDSRVDSCIYSLFGRDFQQGLLSADSSDGTVNVSGFVSSPDNARGNRSYQFFIVNGRPIRSMLLQTALEKAYSNYLHGGRFPACVLYITIRPGDVDVNVHPAKTEVKFFSDKQIFDGVYYATLSAIEAGAISKSTVSPQLPQAGSIRPSETVSQNKAYRTPQSTPQSGKQINFFKNMEVGEYRSSYNTVKSDPPLKYPKETSYTAPAASSPTASNPATLYPTASSTAQPAATSNISPSAEPNEAKPPQETPDLPALHLLGEAFDSYIIVEYNNSVWFIDKHAAHERIHFNALKSEDYSPMSQALITPIICKHGVEDVALLLENAELLDGLGFSVESFGQDCVAVRHIPAQIREQDTESILSEICSLLKLGATAEVTGLDEIYRTIACKAAIKAGSSSTHKEMELLAIKVMSGEASHCPHGRPVTFEVSKTRLDKGFKRL